MKTLRRLFLAMLSWTGTVALLDYACRNVLLFPLYS